jgi:DNA-binding MarR family transcriptional regulator
MEREPVTISAISAAEYITHPTASRSVAALESVGLVRCIPNREDGRSVLVVSTAKGRSILQKSVLPLLHEVAALLGRLEARELQAIAGAIQKVMREKAAGPSVHVSGGEPSVSARDALRQRTL